MAVLPAQTIRKLCLDRDCKPMIVPFHERAEMFGMTFGLGPCTYDFRIKQSIVLLPIWKLPVLWFYQLLDYIADSRKFKDYYCGFALASTIECVNMPLDVCGTVLDKSSWARRGLAVQNTKFDPGFHGHPTIELSNHSLHTLVICGGAPICQFKFERLETPTEMPYAGRYQGQGSEPTPYKVAVDAWG